MMNKPEKLNCWTSEMMAAFSSAFEKASEDAQIKAVIFTGAGHYYSSGLSLGGTLKLMPPKQFHALIVDHNKKLFDTFLNFPKPILAAINGPAIGGCVTSATLCDFIIASDTSTFLTPFSALGITPEGCSSILFARLMGEHNAQRMLGHEGWKPSAQQALTAGLVQRVVKKDQLQSEAQKTAQDWVNSGRGRIFRGGYDLAELQAVNARESIEMADRFLGSEFLQVQFKFLWGKKKRGLAAVFFCVWLSRPLWKRFL
jgi:enoyl-CoA hydratase/carnithine racemase